jgi:hypothetical protein
MIMEESSISDSMYKKLKNIEDLVYRRLYEKAYRLLEENEEIVGMLHIDRMFDLYINLKIWRMNEYKWKFLKLIYRSKNKNHFDEFLTSLNQEWCDIQK